MREEGARSSINGGTAVILQCCPQILIGADDGV